MQRAYRAALRWSAHPHASRYLFGVAVAESSFFPIPPDTLLAPMTLAQPNKAWRYAWITTLGSVIGGVLGWLIGAFAFEALARPILALYHLETKFDQVGAWFEAYAAWIIFAAGFTPIPYKVFTIAAGLFQIPLWLLTAVSIPARGMRFLLVAGLIRWGGEPLQHWLERNIAWLTTALVAVAFGLWWLLKG